MLFDVVFAKTIVFTSQNTVFLKIDDFLFFKNFWKHSWAGGGASHLARAG